MSASDLAKWDIARIDRRILSPEDWATQETAITLTNGTDTHYGLGVSVGSRAGTRPSRMAARRWASSPTIS